MTHTHTYIYITSETKELLTQVMDV